jgi:hypothetical protein
MTQIDRRQPGSGDRRKNKYKTGTTVTCQVDEHSSRAEIGDCIELTRREMNRTRRTLENRLSPEKLFADAKAYLRQNYSRQMDWLSDLPHRIRTNPAPFAIIGAGMLLGGAGLTGYALSKQRRKSGKPAAYKRLTEKSKQTWRKKKQASQEKRRYHPSAVRKHERIEKEYLKSADPEIFNGSQEEQASTEEILRDQSTRVYEDRTEIVAPSI